MRIVLTAPFDPITEKELRYILKERHKRRIRDIYLCPEEEGTALRSVRLRLLEKALAPYRRVHVAAQTGETDICVPIGCGTEDEACVRHGICRLAAQGIRSILFREGIYLEETVRYRCDAYRAAHSLSTAKTAAYLARLYRLDEGKMYRAGCLHDITKNQTAEQNRKIMEHWFPEYLDESVKVWHSFTAEVFVRREMHCGDRQLLRSIRHHTLGDGNSNYDRILYIADKIEPERPYHTEEEWKLAVRDLKEAAAYILEECRQFI